MDLAPRSPRRGVQESLSAPKRTWLALTIITLSRIIICEGIVNLCSVGLRRCFLRGERKRDSWNARCAFRCAARLQGYPGLKSGTRNRRKIPEPVRACRLSRFVARMAGEGRREEERKEKSARRRDRGVSSPHPANRAGLEEEKC